MHWTTVRLLWNGRALRPSDEGSVGTIDHDYVRHMDTTPSVADAATPDKATSFNPWRFATERLIYWKVD